LPKLPELELPESKQLPCRPQHCHPERSEGSQATAL